MDDGTANHRFAGIALVTDFMLKVVRSRGTFSASGVLILLSAQACGQPDTDGLSSGAIGCGGYRFVAGAWM